MLRRLETRDLRDFQRYRQDPEVGQYQGWSSMSDSEASQFLAEMNTATPFGSAEWYQLGIAQCETNALIGDIGVRVADDRNEAEIGFTVARDAQGRGLATTAVRGVIRLLFEHASVTRIVGITDARNAASIRLLERVGMTKIDTRASMFRGEPCTEHVFTVLREAGG